MERTKTYNRIKISVQIISIILNFTLILILIFTPLSKFLETKIYQITSNDYIAFVFFIISIGIISSVYGIPLSFYSSYIVEHKFNLSNQRLSDWIIDKIKSNVISTLITIPILLLFYYFLKNYKLWWLFIALVVFFFSILLARIAPTLIFPIFYKFTPLDNENLKTKLTELCKKFGINFEGIYTFNLSKKTKKANAGFTGIFKSRRIILSDTLIENFNDNEILTVFAHELGHFRKKHILKNILIGFITTTITFYLTNQIYHYLLTTKSYNSIYQISALPLLFLIMSLFTLITMPVTNSISRKFEFEADEFAVKSTGDKASFISSLQKLSRINLADESPNPVIEFIFHSHPSIRKRIERINRISQVTQV